MELLQYSWPCLPHYSQEGEKANERLPWGSGKLAAFIKAVTPLKASAVGLQHLTVSKWVWCSTTNAPSLMPGVFLLWQSQTAVLQRSQNPSHACPVLQEQSPCPLHPARLKRLYLLSQFNTWLETESTEVRAKVKQTLRSHSAVAEGPWGFTQYQPLRRYPKE